MGIWSKLFNSDKAIEGAYKGIDKALLTKEETLDYHLKFVEAYTPFKVLQRIIVLIVSLPFIITYFISAALYVSSLFLEPCLAPLCKSSQLVEGSKFLFNLNTETFGYPFLAVVSFYTGGGMLEGALRARANNKKDR
jgi:hypothetical protein